MAKQIDRIKERNLELLDYYVRLHKKNPRLKYFVPLAEVYRSLDLLDEAAETLQEGLKWHPNYLIARALLSQTYYQMGKFLSAAIESKHVLDNDSHNLLALRISTLSNEKLGKTSQPQAPIFSPGRIEDFEIQQLTKPTPSKTKHKNIAILQQMLKTIQSKTI